MYTVVDAVLEPINYMFPIGGKRLYQTGALNEWGWINRNVFDQFHIESTKFDFTVVAEDFFVGIGNRKPLSAALNRSLKKYDDAFPHNPVFDLSQCAIARYGYQMTFVS